MNNSQPISYKKENLKVSKKKRIKQVVDLLKRYHPSAQCSLFYKTPIQLLVATILSAQCTDKRVNEVTKTLFKKYPSVKSFAQSCLEELQKDIYSTGFFRAKAKSIKSACQKIIQDFKGVVPNTLEDLLTCRGVGRKTAHVVLGTAFNISSGVVVDTHVGRLSYRLGFVESKNPTIIEKALCGLLPKSNWIYFSHALILHGRGVCKSQIPHCNSCFLEEHCPQKGVQKWT